MTTMSIEDTKVRPATFVSNSICDERIDVEIEVKHSYEVFFTNDVFNTRNSLLARCLVGNKTNSDGNILFIIDQALEKHYPDLTSRIENYCQINLPQQTHAVLIIPGGEQAKTAAKIDSIHHQMLNLGIDRQDRIVAVGGGAVIDCAGFAAATFHRGIQIIRLPSTVLAQNDAGIGIKNGINHHGIKNLLGCFTPPHAVINDSLWLDTLSDRDFRSGFAEAVKVALIRDYHFFRWIDNNTRILKMRDQATCLHLIKECARLHLNQIQYGGDPFEQGNARPLDYGHWSGHKLETLSNFELSHGEAVAIGMALDAIYAHFAGLLSLDDTKTIYSVLIRLGYMLYHPSLTETSPAGKLLLLDGLEEFRQHLGGNLCVTLPTGIGHAVEVDQIDNSIMIRAIDSLKSWQENFPASMK